MGGMDTGYKLEERFFSELEIWEVKDGIDQIFQNYTGKATITDLDVMELFATDFEGFHGCAHLSQMLPCIYRMAGSLGMMTMLQVFGLKLPVLNTKPIISISSPRTAKKEHYWKVPPHQDWPSNLGSTNGVTVWIPLVDVDCDLGPLEVVPGSNKLGPQEHVMVGVPVLKNPPEEGWHSIPMQRGDALFFNTMTVHRSGSNQTGDRIRWSLHLRDSDAAERSFIERKYPRNRTGD